MELPEGSNWSDDDSLDSLFQLGRYVHRSKLGTGGLGHLSVVFDQLLKRNVVLKTHSR